MQHLFRDHDDFIIRNSQNMRKRHKRRRAEIGEDKYRKGLNNFLSSKKRHPSEHDYLANGFDYNEIFDQNEENDANTARDSIVHDDHTNEITALSFEETQRMAEFLRNTNITLYEAYFSAVLDSYLADAGSTDNTLFNSDDGSTLTTTEAHAKLFKFCQTHRLTLSGQKDLLVVLSELLPRANLPKTISASRNDVFSQLFSQQSLCNLVREFDCCKNGCTVYFGNDGDRTACAICGEPRFVGSGRVAQRRIYYRSLLGTIQCLLSTSGFPLAVTFANLEQDDRYVKDLLDGTEPIKHLNDMSARFRQVYGSPQPTHIRPINVLLGIASDGAPVREQVDLKFVPNCLCLLNLPPPLRHGLGQGMFLSSIYTVYGKEMYDGNHVLSKVERFLIEDCLNAELNILCRGKEFEAGSDRFFVQARLILHLYDGSHMEHVFSMHGAGSNVGCNLCRCFEGLRIYENQTTYIGYRKFLPLKHFLRRFGQNLRCCPSHTEISNVLHELQEQEINYAPLTNAPIEIRMPPLEYSDAQVYVAQTLISSEVDTDLLLSIAAATSSQCRPRSIFDLRPHELSLIRYCCDNFDFVGYFGFHLQLEQYRTEPPMWYNTEINYEDFSSHLYFFYSDYRALVRLRRVHNSVIRADAERVREIRSNGGRAMDYHINGIKDYCPFFYIPYFNFSTQLCFDPFHVFKNVIAEVFKLLKGVRGTSDSVVEFCTKHNIHPSLRPKRAPTVAKPDRTVVRPCWMLADATQHTVEAFCLAFNRPPGYGDKFNVAGLFTRTGKLPAKHLETAVKCIMEIIVFCASRQSRITGGKWEDVPLPYLSYLRLFALTIQSLSAKCFLKIAIDSLYFRVAEYLAVHEGLFPPSECPFTFHELLELVNFILTFGPLRNWTTLAMERLLGKVKQSVPKGGKSMNKTTTGRLHFIEISEIKSKYDWNIECNFPIQSSAFEWRESFQVFRDQHDEQLKVGFRPNVVVGRSLLQQSAFTFTDQEHNNLLLELVRVSSRDSPLVVIYTEFINLTMHASMFLTWLKTNRAALEGRYNFQLVAYVMLDVKLFSKLRLSEHSYVATGWRRFRAAARNSYSGRQQLLDSLRTKRSNFAFFKSKLVSSAQQPNKLVANLHLVVEVNLPPEHLCYLPHESAIFIGASTWIPTVYSKANPISRLALNSAQFEKNAFYHAGSSIRSSPLVTVGVTAEGSPVILQSSEKMPSGTQAIWSRYLQDAHEMWFFEVDPNEHGVA